MSYPTKSARLHQIAARRQARWLAAAALALVGTASSAKAASTIWSPASSDFNLGTNWSAGAPGPGDIATFTGPFGTAPNTFQPNLTGSIEIGQLLFSDATTFGYDLTSSSPSFALTLSGSAAISSVGAGVNTIDANLVLSAAGTAQSISVSNGGTLVINGSISGTGRLTSAGSGLLKLNSASTYTGGTTIAGGTSVQINNSQALGTGAISLAGTFDNASGNAFTIANANALTLAGNMVFTGSNALGFDTASITMAATRSITVNGSSLTLTGLFDASTAGLSKLGGGTLVLSNTGAQGFTGTTSVTGGTLEVDGTLASTAVTVGTTGTLRIFNPNAIALADVTGSSGGGAILALRNDSDATFAMKSLTITTGLSINADQATAGNTGHTLSVGDLAITGAAATLNSGGGNGYSVRVGTVTVGAAATNTLGNSAVGPVPLLVGALKGGANANVTSLNGAVGGSITGGASDGAASLGISKVSSGTWILGGASSYTGATTVTAGVLQVDGTLGATAISLGAGTLRLTRGDAISGATSLTNTSGSAVLELMSDSPTSFTLPTFTIGANLTINAAQATAAGAGQTLSISNPITLGAFTLTGTSTAGNDTLALGAITTTAATAGLSANSGTLSVASITGGSGAAQTITLGGVTPGVGIVAGAIVNGTSTLSVTKSGTGTWVLAGTNTYTGATTIAASGGVLQVGNGGNTGSLGTAASVTVNAGGALRYNRSDALTVTTNILGAGSVQQSGSNVLTLASTGSTFSGGLTINAGSVKAGNSATGVLGTGVVTLANNTSLDLNGFNETVGMLSSSGTGAGAVVTSLAAGAPVTLTLSAASGTQTYAGAINETSPASAVSVTLNNTGASATQVLSGASNYSGVTTVAAGYLNIQGSQALGSTAGGTVVTGGRLQLQGGVKVTGEALTLTGVTGAPTVLENVSGDNEWAGPISGNTLLTLRLSSLAGTLTLSGPIQTATTGTQDANGLLPQGPGTILISGNVSGIGKISQGLASTGTLVLSGDNSAWSGGLKVQTGTVRSLDSTAYTGNATVKSTLGTGALNLTSGTLDLRVNGQDDATSQTLSFGNALVPATSSSTAFNVDRQGGSGTNKTIAFASTALITGTNWNITGDHGYSLNLGAATFNSSNGTVGLSPLSANVTINTLQVITGSPSSVTPAQLVLGGTTTGNVIAGNLTKSGSTTAAAVMGLIKSGSSTWSLQGTASTYSQPTVLLGGTLSISALANIGASSSIGLGLTASNAGSLLLNGGTLQFTGATAGTTDRLFTVATAGGTLDASGSAPLVFSNPGAIAVTDSGSQTGTTGNANSVVTAVSFINDLAIGQTVTGGNIAAGTTITGIDPAARSITLSQPTNATGGATATALTFGSLDRTLTLTGTSTLDNTLGSTLGDSATKKLSLAKTGAGTWLLTGANTFTGSTIVSGGTLRGSAEGVLGATSSVAVTNAASLLFSGATTTTNGRVNDAAPVTLSTGGTLGYAAAESSRTEALGALTLATSATLDLGAGTANTLTFAGLSSFTGTLQVQHWTGSLYAPSDTDSGSATQDRLLFAAGTSFTPAQLASISFFGDNNAFLGTARQITYNGQVELVAAIPEPTTLSSLLAVGALLGLRRRRPSQGVRRAA